MATTFEPHFLGFDKDCHGNILCHYNINNYIIYFALEIYSGTVGSVLNNILHCKMG